MELKTIAETTNLLLKQAEKLNNSPEAVKQANAMAYVVGTLYKGIRLQLQYQERKEPRDKIKFLES